MPTSHPISALAAVLACALVMTGCVGDTPDSAPTPTPTSTPVFASEEEALAAATEAYERYQALSDQILSEGGADPERIDEVAVDDARSDSYQSFVAFVSNEYRSVGATTFGGLLIQQFVPHAQLNEEVVIAYTCVNVGQVDVLDSAGVSVVSPDRPDAQAFQASFVLNPGVSGALVVAANDAWGGDGVCREE